MQYGDRQYFLGPGDVFCCFPNQPHGYFDSVDVEGYMLIVPVNPLLTTYHSIFTYQQPVCPVIHFPQWQEDNLGILLRMALAESEQVSEHVMQGYFIALVGKYISLFELKPSSSVTDHALRNILRYINSHYREPITRKQIAAEVGYNESYISRIFSQTIRTTLPKYLNSLRVYDASRYLAETDMSMAAIASELGFGSVRSFNRVFLEEVGMTPREYRSKERI